jgi:hypothetical protein
MKILFVCKKRITDYGETIGLINSAKFISSYLNSIGFDCSVSEAIDGNCVDRLVTEVKPDLVIIEALWVSPDKLQELMDLHKNKMWLIRIHSKLPFLAQEGIALDWIKEYVKIAINSNYANLIIAPNTKELTNQFRKYFDFEIFHLLENIYEFKELPSIPKNNPETINIACMGAIRPLKNQLSQAMAAIEFGKNMGQRINFHINANRVEQKGENTLKNLRSLFEGTANSLIEHSWYDQEDFLRFIKTMDIGMQVSLTESFNLVTADFVSQRVPIIVGEDIEWMPNFTKVVPTDYNAIVKKLKDAYKNPKCYGRRSYYKLEEYNKKAKLGWYQFVKNC